MDCTNIFQFFYPTVYSKAGLRRRVTYERQRDRASQIFDSRENRYVLLYLHLVNNFSLVSKRITTLYINQLETIHCTYIIVFKNDCHNLRQHAVRTFTPLCFCSVALAIDWDDEEWISASRVIFLFSYGEIDNSVHLLESLIRGAETTTTTSTIRSTCTPTPSTPLSSPIETLSVCFVGIQWKQQQLNPYYN